jgi:hypothetical protein
VINCDANTQNKARHGRFYHDEISGSIGDADSRILWKCKLKQAANILGSRKLTVGVSLHCVL